MGVRPQLPSDRRRLASQPTVEMGSHLQPRRRRRTLGRALLVTGAATVLPGSGHLLLGRRIGAVILGGFVVLLGGATVFVLVLSRNELLQYLLSARVLRWVIVGCVLAALLWVAVIVRTYWLAKPHRLSTGPRLGGAAVVLLLCLAVVAPFGYGAYLANAQRSLLNVLFPAAGTDGVSAFDQPRINIFLVGSDAGPDRTGARTDSMVVASIDTATGQTTLFGLPRNISYAQFPPDSAMAQKFPTGFHDPRDPSSGNYLLNAVYAYGTEYPDLTPPGPSDNPGLNLLYSSVGYMLGLHLDYYIEMNMQGFASLVDALGGVDVQVGPNRIPMGGIGPHGEQIKPFGYIPPGSQHLSGEAALWFARSRTNTSDYERMGRQRCLIQDLIDQKSPTDVLRNYQAVAAATANSLATNIPQSVLPSMVALAGKTKEHPLQSLTFDPTLPDPGEPDGKFNTSRPDFTYMRQVVQHVIDPSTAPPTTPPSRSAQPSRKPGSSTAPSSKPGTATLAAPTATPVGASCGVPPTTG